MNILLDYFFKITNIDPTPAASTAFLKQVCVVASPKDGGVSTDIITLCTTIAQVQDIFGSSASSEVQKLFDAGLSRVYVLPMDDLDLADALEGHESDFFTILISSDFTAEEIEHSDAVSGVKAYVKLGDITFTAVTAGVAGNSQHIILLDDVSAGGEWAHASGSTVTIHMEDGASTAQQIADALADSVAASALLTAVIDGGDAAVVQADASSTALAHGVDADAGSEDGLQVGAFTGVVGVSDDDDDFLEDQAAIAGRVAFHTTTSNKAKNMFYAFGKLLSNSLDWLNQQYITMPLADDVGTLGDAENLFDEKISFVISDSEFGERLALFAVGGKAIVAPYIVRNLQLDLQSSALSYISGNQPSYTKKHAALLEDELKKVVQLYISRGWLEAGTVEVLLEEDNFVASGDMNIAEPKALWRVVGEMRQTL